MNKSIENSNVAQLSSFLGIDFGKSKIGLAVADGETKIAFALITLVNNKEFLAKLQEIIERENVKTIVIGITRHEKDQKSVDEKIAFGTMIERKFGITVMFQDEMFTTKMAQANIKLQGGRNIAKDDDKEAARIILQSWFDRDVQPSQIKTLSHES